MSHKFRYTLIDLCSGNALVPLMSAFMMPVKHSYAVDRHKRDREWNLVKNFTYENLDINKIEIEEFINGIEGDIILTSCHPCRDLAARIIDIYNNTNNIKKLVIMPCCEGKNNFKISKEIVSKISRPLVWSLHLSIVSGGNLSIDHNVLSHRNYIISADK